MELKVTGMTCGHCEQSVRKALEGLAGVERVVKVDRSEERAVLEGNVDAAAAIAAIVEEGFTAEVIA